MERSFANEIESLKLGDGEAFQGEGILAVTRALLRSGMSHVGGYQDAPASRLIDVMVRAVPRGVAVSAPVPVPVPEPKTELANVH